MSHGSANDDARDCRRSRWLTSVLTGALCQSKAHEEDHVALSTASRRLNIPIAAIATRESGHCTG